MFDHPWSNFTAICLMTATTVFPAAGQQTLHPLSLQQVHIQDAFWSPRLHTWDSITVGDVFDKLEGHYLPDRPDLIEEKAATGTTRNALANFDRVAGGETNTGVHDGPPWYDGLLYETIRGASDLLIQFPDSALERKIDRYIDKIAAAQSIDKDGYIETYTTLTRPDKRWGTNGGDDKWQHDIYNAGMLVDAAVHYYKATGKTKLLQVAVRISNYMCRQMGPEPRLNVIPGHGGPEQALLNLYELFRSTPELKRQMGVPVQEKEYNDLAIYWIENRGHYGVPGSAHFRKSDESYNQDQSPVVDQTSIEGHAVRATLLAAGVTQAAMMNNDPRYSNVANRYWNNMIGRRMFITGGEGAIADGERFGPDYFLPESAYLETCAAIGAGFFSEEMNQLQPDGKYMDALERILYNNFLSGIALDGAHYYYENPLIADGQRRWSWHSCPCCPPMILKMAGELPRYIYAYDDQGLYVNLFIGSDASLSWKNQPIRIHQSTEYPWKGDIALTLNPQSPVRLLLRVRIPGWAVNEENPYGLYNSHAGGPVKLTVNGRPVDTKRMNGYAVIDRIWKKGDKIILTLPIQPRIVRPSDSVKTIKGKCALAAGPIVYALEAVDNDNLDRLMLDPQQQLQLDWQPAELHGVNRIKAMAQGADGQSKRLTAIPFYALGNRVAGSPYKVWIPAAAPGSAAVNHITVDASDIRNHIPSTLFGSCMEDVNHEIYGGFYAQLIMGESFEEPASGVNYNDWKKQGGYWAADREYGDNSLSIIPGRHTRRMVGPNELGVEPDENARLIYEKELLQDGTVTADIRLLQTKGRGAGLLVRAGNVGIGANALTGYEIRLNRKTNSVQIVKHLQDERVVAEAGASITSDKWMHCTAELQGTQIKIYIDDSLTISYVDNEAPILQGRIGLATAGSPASFRNVRVVTKDAEKNLPLVNAPDIQISDRWDMIASGTDNARCTLVQHDAYNGLAAQIIENTKAGEKAGIANRGLNRWGLSIEKGQMYTGDCFMQSATGPVSVTAALESADGTRTYARQVLQVDGRRWQQVRFSLVAEQSDTNARFALYFQQPGRISIDQVSLFPSAGRLYKDLPMRADIGRAIVGEGLTFMRYAGTMVNAAGYRFKKMIGPRASRPPYTGHWNEYSTNGFGIEDFLQFCEAARSTPAFAINIEETPQDAADMIDYLNGDEKTTWGRKRSENGHPGPYAVKYIEIGNEEVLFEGDDARTADHYIDRFRMLYEAIHGRDPGIQLVCSAWWRPESSNTERIFKALDGKAAYWDYHVGGDDPGSGASVDKSLTRMEQLFHQWNPSTTMRCAIFEENGGLHNIQRALGHATNLNAARRHGNFLLTSCPANALQPWHQNDNDWDQGQIFFTPDTVWGMPPYYVQQMAAANYLPLRVKDSTDGALDVTATRSEDGKTLVLHLVNTASSPADASIHLAHFNSREGRVISIAGSLSAENTPENTRTVTPVESAVRVDANGSLRQICPPWSYTIIRLQAR